MLGGALLAAALVSLCSPVVARACSPAVTRAAVARALLASPGNASAAASAFIAACDRSKPWNEYDVRKYIYSNWHAGEPTGASCGHLRRFGNFDDGGKMLCEPRQLLAPPCHVVSIGSQGDTSFEAAVHAFAPHCVIETHDGTLTPAVTASLPAWLHFVPENMHAGSWRRWLRSGSAAKSGGSSTLGRVPPPLPGGKISLLKVDCEGCEVDSVLPMVEHFCVEQLIVEVHGCGGSFDVKGKGRHFRRRVERAHYLLVALDALYLVFHVEMNIIYSDGTCLEYALKRRVPCGESSPA